MGKMLSKSRVIRTRWPASRLRDSLRREPFRQIDFDRIIVHVVGYTSRGARLLANSYTL